MNICMCGVQAGYPHAPNCPYPLYHGTETQYAAWRRAYENHSYRWLDWMPFRFGICSRANGVAEHEIARLDSAPPARSASAQ